MNLHFYRSWHAVVAAVCLAALFAWHCAAPRGFGDRDDANLPFLLWTGWLAVAAYVALLLYAARRAAHRLRMTPEFGWKVALPVLERTQSELAELQNRIDRRELTGRAEVRRAVAQILAREGAKRVLRCTVVADRSRLGALRLEVGPREALGRLSTWLSAHVWYGLAAALLVWFHGGARTASTMGLLLNALSAFVIGSGILGAVMWTFAPTWLTRAERELSIEKAFALREHFARKLAAARAELQALPTRRQAAAIQQAQATAELAGARSAAEGNSDKALAKAVKDAEKAAKECKKAVDDLDRLEQRLPLEIQVLAGQGEQVRREAARLDRVRLLLRGWRLLHVPASVVLLALVTVHVVSIYYY